MNYETKDDISLKLEKNGNCVYGYMFFSFIVLGKYELYMHFTSLFSTLHEYNFDMVWVRANDVRVLLQ